MSKLIDQLDTEAEDLNARPIALTWQGWERRMAKMRRDRPVRYFLKVALPRWWRRSIARPIHNGVWWLKYRLHPAHRYHVVRTGLPPGWHDRDEVLLHVAFQVLRDFIEREKPHRHFDVRHSDCRARWRQLFRLYRWWTRHRPRRNDDPLDGYNGPNKGPERDAVILRCHEQGRRGWDEDQAMLHRLIEVRDLMWT